MSQPAARLGDPVAHTLPPILTGAPCSPNVWIGSQPAWLGADPAQIVALMETVKQAKEEIAKAGHERELATGTIAEGDAITHETETIVEQTKRVGGAIANLAASGVSVHNCTAPLPTPAPGIVITGSLTVKINGLAACQLGDVLFEGLHTPNAITGGCPTVWIGG